MSAINIEVTKNVFDVNLQQDVTTFDVTLERGYYPLPSDIDLSNYFTKQEAIDNFKPIIYNPDIDEILTNGNIASKSFQIKNILGGEEYTSVTSSTIYYINKYNPTTDIFDRISINPSLISSQSTSGNTELFFAPKTKTAFVIIPNKSGTVVLDYQLNDFYTQTQIDNLLSNKQYVLGYTPEDVANKSDSYTASYSTTYASSKALVDGLATKQKKVTVITITGNTTLSETHNGAVLNVTNPTSFLSAISTGWPYRAGRPSIRWRCCCRYCCCSGTRNGPNRRRLSGAGASR